MGTEAKTTVITTTLANDCKNAMTATTPIMPMVTMTTGMIAINTTKTGKIYDLIEDRKLKIKYQWSWNQTYTANGANLKDMVLQKGDELIPAACEGGFVTVKRTNKVREKTTLMRVYGMAEVDLGRLVAVTGEKGDIMMKNGMEFEGTKAVVMTCGHRVHVAGLLMLALKDVKKGATVYHMATRAMMRSAWIDAADFDKGMTVLGGFAKDCHIDEAAPEKVAKFLKDFRFPEEIARAFWIMASNAVCEVSGKVFEKYCIGAKRGSEIYKRLHDHAIEAHDKAVKQQRKE